MFGLSESIDDLPKHSCCLFPANGRVELERLEIDTAICKYDKGVVLIIIE